MSGLQAILVLIGITCMISSVTCQTKGKEDINGLTSDSFQNKKSSTAMEKLPIGSSTRPRRYRRPHIERVWIMRSFDANRNASALRNNLTDPVRSFAIAIRDPETFLHYLKEEEKRLLANSSATKQKQQATPAVGGSRYVLLNMLSQELMENMKVTSSHAADSDQQNGNRSSDTAEETPLFQPSWSGNETNEENSVINEEPRNRMQQIIPHRRIEIEENAPHLQHFDERQHQEHTHIVQQKQQRRRPRKQKQQRRHKGDQYRQKLKTDEPLIVFGEFGQRLPNYTRPSAMRDFNRSRSLEVLMTPSIYLLPPVVTNFRHFNLQQPMLTIIANTMKHPPQRRKHPRTSTTHSPFDAAAVFPDVSQESTVSSLKTSTPDSRNQNFNELGISAKVFAPRPFSVTPFSMSSPPSLPNRSEILQNFSDHHPLPSEHQAVSPPTQTPLQTNPKASRQTQERNTYMATINITPPSTKLTPPIVEVYNGPPESYATGRDFQLSTQSQKNDVVQLSQYTEQENLRSTLFQLSADDEIATNDTTFSLSSLSKAMEHLNTESHKHLQTHDEERELEPNYMAIIVDVDFVNRTGRRKSSRHHQPRYDNLIEEDYGELQLTAAETAYFKRKQPAMLSNTVLEQMEEIGSIPGVPGMDYPIFSRPPKTSFSCANMQGRRGYFADVNTGCQVFYICSEDGRGDPMLCPNGTLFNKDFLVCDWWFNVICEGAS